MILLIFITHRGAFVCVQMCLAPWRLSGVWWVSSSWVWDLLMWGFPQMDKHPFPRVLSNINNRDNSCRVFSCQAVQLVLVFPKLKVVNGTFISNCLLPVLTSLEAHLKSECLNGKHCSVSKPHWRNHVFISVHLLRKHPWTLSVCWYFEDSWDS